MIGVSRMVRQTGEMNKQDFDRVGHPSCSSIYTQIKIVRTTF